MMTYFPTQKRYDAKNRIRVNLSFNRKTEPEITERIEKEKDRAAYIKRLIKEDIDRGET